jgi:ABC-2 type transport system permease protein
VLGKALHGLRWQVFWYGLGLAVMAAFIVYIYPSYSEQLADIEIPEALQGFVGEADYATAPGFISTEALSWFPIVLVVFAIMAGTSAAAGEEVAGTLDLVLAQPISRARFLLEKLAGLALAALGICVLVYGGWLISVPFVDIDVGLGELAVATVNFLPLVLFFQAFALWAGVTLSSRSLATGAAAAVAVVSFFINYLGATVEVLDPARWASVFFHYHGSTVLTEGVDWTGWAVLWGLYVLFAGWALVSFQRRDIGVGAPAFRLPFARPSAPPAARPGMEAVPAEAAGRE